MNIGIDLSPTVTGHAHRGTGVYAANLFQALRKSNTEHTFTEFDRTKKLSGSIDLVHFPYFDPFFLTLRPPRCPFVTTVHDLIPIEYPERFPKGFKGELKWQIQRAHVRKSRRIITDSQSSADSIRRLLPYPDSRIDVVYLAPTPRTIHRQKLPPAAVLEKYGIRAPYFLYVGDVNWNKNLDGMLAGFRMVPELMKSHGMNVDPTLVLVGQAFRDSAIPEVVQLLEMARSTGLSPKLVFPGRVPDQDLLHLYTSAVATVLVSHAEGFGLPVLEAMASGCPVVTSATSSLKEIAGPSLQVNPDEAASIAQALVRMLMLSESERVDLVSAGRQWAARYRWEKVAAETIQCYEKASTLTP